MTSLPDVLQLAAGVMEQRGHRVTRHDGWLEHRDSGLAIRPHLVDCLHRSPRHVQSISTVAVRHPDVIPDGLFEYQHALGATLDEALRSGFEQWLQIDFLVLLDAVKERAEHCSALEFKWENDVLARRRRALLGPIGHMAAHPAPAASEVEHPFCPCCLLTNTQAAFAPLIRSDDFFGIRLLAIRNDDGSAQADCRINGEDFRAGQQALCDYVQTWPQAGYEFRKQYVVLQTLKSVGPGS